MGVLCSSRRRHRDAAYFEALPKSVLSEGKLTGCSVFSRSVPGPYMSIVHLANTGQYIKSFVRAVAEGKTY